MSDTKSKYSSLQNVTTYQAGVMQASAHRVLQKHCDAILKPHGITKMQWLIIGTVQDAGNNGVRITDLADTLDTTLPYLTNTINILESKDILVREAHSSDVRAKLVKVHPEFLPQCAIIEKTLRERLRKSVYARITPEDFRVYMKVLAQLSELQ